MDKTTTNFPKMGTVNGVAVNVSAAPSGNTKPVKKYGEGVGGMIQNALYEGVRRNMQERGGAKLTPQTRMVAETNPEAGANLRNTKLVPSAIGNRDFYDKRKFGQVMQ